MQISKLIFKIIIKISLFLNNLKEDFLEHNGYKIAYLKSKKFKNSDTIIFIHGLNDQKETWLELSTWPKYITYFGQVHIERAKEVAKELQNS